MSRDSVSGEESESQYSGSEAGSDDDFDDMDDIPLDVVNAHDAPQKRKATEIELAESQPGGRKDKKLKSEYLKPPTSEELSRLKETENLFHSNIFRLQIEELLNEIKVKDKYQTPIQKWVDSFRSFLIGLPETESFKLEDTSYLKELGVESPFQESKPDKKTIFRYLPPSEVKIIGSHSLGATLKPTICVDVGVQMPKRLFREKDPQDYRYFRKRALYLAYIAGHLKKSDMQTKLMYSTTDDPFLPVLEVTPSGKLEKSVKFVIRPFGDESYFKISKFAPMGNNIRASWLSTGEQTDHLPTPKYNSSMLKELLLGRNEASRTGIFQQVPAAGDSLLLLKVWLHQRKLDQGIGAFTPFIMSMFLVYLIQQKRVNMFMSSYQIVRNVLMHLAKADLSGTGITLCKTQGSDGVPSLADFTSSYEVVFVDETGFLNFCGHMSVVTWNRVQKEATLSGKILDSSSGRQSFEALFMTPMGFLTSMDHILRIEKRCLEDALKCKSVIDVLKSTNLAFMDSGKMVSRTIMPAVLTVLRRALEGRTSLIALEGHEPSRCEVNASFKDNVDDISLGFALEPEKAWNSLIKGPEANHPEASEFRNFWGEKSQLRRFQDGTVSEAVVFPAKTLDEKRLITKQIISHVLERHLSVKEITYVADQLDMILRQPRFEGYGTGEEANAAIVRTLDGLGRQLRGLEDLPLTITSVQGISAAFRYTDVFPAIPGLPQGDERCLRKGGACMLPNFNKHLVPTYIEPLKVIVSLETSNKWPDDLTALRRLKAAFYLAISKELMSKFDLVTIPSPTHVDVLKDGFVFRLSISYPREIVLAKTFRDTDGILKQRDTDTSLRLEKETSILPKISAALHGLQSQYPSFGAATRLAKRWVAGHMLSSHMPELVTELIVASTYLDLPSLSTSGPMSPQAGFLQFLRKISTTDWKVAPLVLNFNDILGGEEIAEMEAEFSAKRESLPPLVILTPYVKNLGMLTSDGPSLPVLARVMILAAQTLKILETSLNSFNPDSDAFKMVFRPTLNIYDVVIHLKPKMVAKRYMNLDAKTSGKTVGTLPVERIKMIPVVGFEPVDCYLEELQEAYGDIAKFFYDSFGGFAIGVLWDKKAMDDVDFKISNVKARTLTSTGTLGLNIDAIIQDFSLIGKGLIDRIELNSDKWIVPT